MLGPRIAALRRSAGLSQFQLAQRLKISPSAVGMYEQGRREPSVALLIALGRELGVSMDYLLKGIPQPEEAEALEAALERRLDAALERMEKRKIPALDRQELAMLFAAMLTEEAALDE